MFTLYPLMPSLPHEWHFTPIAPSVIRLTSVVYTWNLAVLTAWANSVIDHCIQIWFDWGDHGNLEERCLKTAPINLKPVAGGETRGPLQFEAADVLTHIWEVFERFLCSCSKWNKLYFGSYERQANRKYMTKQEWLHCSPSQTIMSV